MRVVQAAALARAEAVWNAAQVHEVGGVPDSPVSPYLVVGSGAASAENHLNCGTHGSRGYRLVVQAVGRNAAEVGFAVDKAEDAFLDHRLDVAAHDTTPATIEVASPVIRDPDGGSYLVCTLSFTFAAYPI